MYQPYYIFFSFKHLHYQGYDSQPLSDSMRFKAEVFQDGMFVGKTAYSEQFLNSKFSFRNKSSLVSLVMPQNSQEKLSLGEIRLIQRCYNSDEILIGCYNFPLNNHIQAFKTLNKNCLRMAVEITECYQIEFDVLIQTSEEAFEKLKQQHFSAKILEEVTDISSVMGTFRPEEHLISTKRESYKAIKMEGQTVPMISRYWTPEKTRQTDLEPKCHRRRNSFIFKGSQNSKKTTELLKSSLKLTYKRTVSECSEELQKKETLDTEPFCEELDTLSQLLIEEKKDDKKQSIEELIRSESVIILPCKGNDYWTYKQLTDRSVEEKTSEEQTQDINECEKVPKGGFLRKVMLALVLMLLIGVGMGVMVKSVRRQKHRNRFFCQTMKA